MQDTTAKRPKLSAAEQRARREDRIAAIRLRMAIGHELDARGITAPAAIGAALGMPAAEARSLLAQRRSGGMMPCVPRATPKMVPCRGVPDAGGTPRSRLPSCGKGLRL